MNIQTVRDNLKNTIAGKEKYLQDLVEKAEIAVFPEAVAYNAMVEMLAISIDELKRILQDVEQCIPSEPEFNDTDSEEVRNLIRMGR